MDTTTLLESVVWTTIMLVTGLLLPLLLEGIRRIVRARIQRRIGPPILQAFYDLGKLFNIPPVLPTKNMLFIVIPYTVFTVSVLLAAMIPIPYVPGLSMATDMITFIYILILVILLSCLAGLVVSNPYMNAGSSRELYMLSVIEVFTALLIAAFAVKLGTLNLYDIAVRFGQLENMLHPSTMLLVVSLFIYSYMESGYVPFDVAEAETEVLGGPFLEYSGRYYGLMMYAGLIKRFVLASIVASLVFVSPITNYLSGFIGRDYLPIISYIIYIVSVVMVSMFYYVIEAMNPRYRVDIAVKPVLLVSFIPLTALILGWFGW